MNYRAIAKRLLVKRFLICLPFMALSVYLLVPPRLVSILGALPLVTAAILLGEPVSMLISGPADSVYFPSGRNRLPRLGFSLPEARVMDGEYEEAWREYTRIMNENQERVEVYLRMVGLAIEHMKRPDRAHEVLALGMKNLKQLEERKKLSCEYRRLMAIYSWEHGECE